MIYSSDSKLIIRDLLETDAKLLESVPEEEQEDASKYRFEYYFEEIQKGIHKTIVAEIEGNIAGYINIYPGQTSFYDAKGSKEASYLNDFYVLKQYRGQGVGSALLETAEKISAAFAPEVFLFSEIENTIAIQFYEKRGYQRADTLVYDLDKTYSSIEEFNADKPRLSFEVPEYKYCKRIK